MILTVLSFALFPALAHASAILVDAQGKVEVALPGGKSAPLQAGISLPDGSVVKVESGGKAAVLLESGAMDTVTAGTSYTVGAKVEKAQRTELGSGIAIAMRELVATGEAPTVHGMVKEAKGPTGRLPDFSVLGGAEGFNAIYPVSIAIRFQNTLTFRWAQPANWPAPALVLDDAQKKRLAVIPIPANAKEVTASAANLYLAKGAAFSWYLATKEKGGTGKGARSEFSVLSEKEEQTLDATLANVRKLGLSEVGQALLCGQIYYQHKMYDDLTRTLAPIIGSDASPFAKQLLFTAYSRMGRTEEAAKYR
jgi:hypothetical protein